MTCNILPRPEPNPKRVNFMARLGPTRLCSTRSVPNWNILSSIRNNPVSDYNKPVNEWSNNIVQHPNQCPILAVLTQVGNARHSFHLITLYFRNSRKKYVILREKIPQLGPNRNLYPRPDPTWKYSQKRVPIPDWFQSGPVWSGETRVFGLPRRSLMTACIWGVFDQLYRMDCM